MRSLEELAAIRDKSIEQVELRKKDAHRKRIVVGMGTAGIAAGARTILQEIVRAVSERGLKDVTVEQSAAVDVPGEEPIVEIQLPEQNKITYVRVTPGMISEIITESVENGRTIQRYAKGQ